MYRSNCDPCFCRLQLLTLPRTQACFPRPIVLFWLGDGISLTASAYQGIRSNANSRDRKSHTSLQSSNRSHSKCTLQLGCHDFTISPQDVSDQTLLLILDFSGRRLASPVRTATSHTTLLIPGILFPAKCKAQIVGILFLVFSSDVIISPYSLEMSPQNSASHFTLPRTQACFPRPIVLFCLGDEISLTASAYRGIQSNANSEDRSVTHSLVVVFSSVKLKS